MLASGPPKRHSSASGQKQKKVSASVFSETVFEESKNFSEIFVFPEFYSGFRASLKRAGLGFDRIGSVIKVQPNAIVGDLSEKYETSCSVISCLPTFTFFFIFGPSEILSITSRAFCFGQVRWKVRSFGAFKASFVHLSLNCLGWELFRPKWNFTLVWKA